MFGEAWAAARGWLTPPVLFLFINIVVGTIVVANRLMATAAEADDDGGERRGLLLRAPSAAFDRFRCFSFSRLGVPSDADSAPAADDEGEQQRRGLFLRAPSAAFDRLRRLSFSRLGPGADNAPAPEPPLQDGAADKEPSSQPTPREEAAAEAERDHALRVERTRSEAAAVAPARRRPRPRRRPPAAEPAPAHLAAADKADGHDAATTGSRHADRDWVPAAVEVDEQADDFIRRFREQLRLQRLDSILRHGDALRRTGTA
ncbi:hypothetical protein ACP70R_028668 [Stipagrostis hirtigluma subsp. patula]